MSSRILRRAAALTTTMMLTAVVVPARAQWAAGGNPVCLSPRGQSDVRSVSDGAGGAIMVWADQRAGGWDLYAQRVNAAGQSLWTIDGVAMCSARGDQDPLETISDGAGGAIVVWHDYRCGSSVFAQRISSSGVALWTAGGVPVTTSPDCRFGAQCAPDGAGGVIVAYSDFAHPVNRGSGVFIQRIDGNGAVRWGPVGVALASGENFSLAADGSGGAFVGWTDNGTGALIGQRVDSTGAALWGAGAVVAPAVDGIATGVVADGLGGAIYAFSYGAPRAQRVDGMGHPLWTAGGVQLATSGGGTPFAVADGAHGAIVIWQNGDLWAQRVDASGTVLWLGIGNIICAAVGTQSAPSVAPDGAGGLFAVWQDNRSGGWDVYGQRLSPAGWRLWVPNGLPVCTAANDQTGPTLVLDGHGGVIAAWTDARSSAVHAHVYAQRIDSAGTTPSNVGVGIGAPRGFRILPPAPNPTRAAAMIAFELSAPARVSVDLYDLQGRRVRNLIAAQALAAGRHDLLWDGRDERGGRVAAGLYFVRVRAAGEEGRCRLVVVH